MGGAIQVLALAIQAIATGTKVLTVLDSLAALRDRLRQENREDVTDQDLDTVRARIQARQDRINQAP